MGAIPSTQHIVHAVGNLANALITQGKTLCTVESCTGGGIGAALTSIPGSSAWFLGGFICYHNTIKHKIAGVAPSLIEAHGAVSLEVAEAMAKGGQASLTADIAIATTGIAGPDGGSTTKPVGTVYISVAIGHRVATERYLFEGARWNEHGNERESIRTQIRTQTIHAALSQTLNFLNNSQS